MAVILEYCICRMFILFLDSVYSDIVVFVMYFVVPSWLSLTLVHKRKYVMTLCVTLLDDDLVAMAAHSQTLDVATTLGNLSCTQSLQWITTILKADINENKITVSYCSLMNRFTLRIFLYGVLYRVRSALNSAVKWHCQLHVFVSAFNINYTTHT